MTAHARDRITSPVRARDVTRETGDPGFFNGVDT